MNELLFRFWGKDVTDMSIEQINTLFKEHDESHKWPILNRFNATERAIQHLQGLDLFIPDGGIEYALALDKEISKIVNNQI